MSDEGLCPICGDKAPDAPRAGREIDDMYCRACSNRYPSVLLKAMVDTFDYAVGLRNGAVILFASAFISGDWVVLHTDGGPSADDDFRPYGYKYQCPRGVEIRVSDIAWLADAPGGS